MIRRTTSRSDLWIPIAANTSSFPSTRANNNYGSSSPCISLFSLSFSRWSLWASSLGWYQFITAFCGPLQNLLHESSPQQAALTWLPQGTPRHSHIFQPFPARIDKSTDRAPPYRTNILRPEWGRLWLQRTDQIPSSQKSLKST